MMPDSLLDKIRSNGYVRVVIKPTFLPETLKVTSARQLVVKSSVSLRGWDYPHISVRNDEHGGSEYLSEYAQDWCDWHQHIEFWRLYKSGQFLHYKALREDILQGDNIPEGPVLGVRSFIFTVTEIVEFAHRLRAAGLYKEGSTIQVTLGQTRGRRLWVEDPRRIDFFTPMVTSSDLISAERAVESSDLLFGDPKDIALPILAEFFDAFGWTPSDESIRSTQDELYSRGLGRGR